MYITSDEHKQLLWKIKTIATATKSQTQTKSNKLNGSNENRNWNKQSLPKKPYWMHVNVCMSLIVFGHK